MQSPFPGMDPYLEDPAFWPDFHLTFIGAWREAIADVLPESYEARLDEAIHVVPVSSEKLKLPYPDVAVSRRKKSGAKGPPSQATALLEPVVIPHELTEEVRQARIEILHRPQRKLVCVLEMLSPANKRGEGFMEFCAKRISILQQKVHLVELDLLVAGQRLPLAEPLPPGDYFALISRANRRPDCEVYAWSVRQTLPSIPLPLLPPDADAIVDLQLVFRQAYERGRYGRSLPYGRIPSAPLKKDDKTWARRLSAR